MKTYISRILTGTWYPDICKTDAEYKILAKRLHPDVTDNLEAHRAFTHLTMLKNNFEKGIDFQDESGVFRTNYQVHRWIGEENLLKLSKENYDKIIYMAENNFDAESRKHFMHYVPSNLEFEGNDLVYRSKYKCIPLSRIIQELPEDTRMKHVNWIYSRMIEWVCLLESLEIIHAGINPDSVFVIPEIHGIKITSFYHVCINRVKTINGKYKNYYPVRMFNTRQAGSYIDISLAKKTAICALGDQSGSGVKLRSVPDYNQEVLNYLLLPENQALISLKSWRDILNRNFIKEFVKLEI